MAPEITIPVLACAIIEGMKVCSACKIEKPRTEFGKDRNKPDGLRGECKLCRNEKAARWQEANRERKRAYLAKLKSVPCADCGNTFPPVCMDFDHVSGDKTAIISNLVFSNKSESRIQEELAKCEVVCSNCHRIRTFITRQQCGAPRKYDRDEWAA